VFLISALLAMACSAAPASAFSTHVFSSSFGGPGSEAGQMSLRAPVVLSGGGRGVVGSGVAVNAASHDVYVADTGNDRVDEFEPDGTFVRAWGWGVDGLPGFGECTTISGCHPGSSGPGQFQAPAFIAIDNAPGGEGNVYVGDTADATVWKFTSEGALIESWGSKGQLTSSPATPFTELLGLAVDSSGTLDVLIKEDEPHKSVVKFVQATGAFIEEFGVPRLNEPSGLAVDGAGDLYKVRIKALKLSATGEQLGTVTTNETQSVTSLAAAGSDLYVDQGGLVEHFAFTGPTAITQRGGGSCAIEVGGNGCPASDVFGAEQLAASNGGVGVTVDESSGTVFVADSVGDVLDAYVPAVLPEVTSEPAQEVQPTVVTATGTVNPEGLTLKPGIEGCRFEWGNTTAYGNVAECEPATPSGTSPVPVKALLSGLQPDTTYHYRLAAAAGEHSNHGVDETFETTGPPTIRPIPPMEITRTAATIQAEIKVHGFLTHYLVEYGTTPAFGSTTPTGELEATAGEAEISVPISDLTLATTYHYRVVAFSECEPANPGHECTVDGPEVTLTTLSAAPIEEENVIRLDAGEAEVGASIDAFGEPTSYRVEYGESEAYGSSTPETSLGSAAGPAMVSAVLSGLKASTTYHFRFVAHNHAGTTDGTDTPFTTSARSAATATLPDGRTYELVSDTEAPTEVYYWNSPYAAKNSELDVPSTMLAPAAAGGGAVVYTAEPPAAGGTGNLGRGLGDSWLARRGPEGGWTTGVITPPSDNAVGGTEFQAFSPDLTSAVLAARVRPPLAPGAPACKEEAGGGINTEGDLYEVGLAGSASRALFTTTVTPGRCGQPLFAGSSADGSAVAFQDEAALTPGAVEAEVPAGVAGKIHETNKNDECEFGCNLYYSTPSGLALVNVLEGRQVRSATFGGFGGVEPAHGSPAERPGFSGAVSQDGSRAFWTDTETGADYKHVFVYEGGTNVPVSAGAAEFWTATPDGRYAYYTESGELWQFDTVSGTRVALVAEGLHAEAAGVLGVVGINTAGEDGAYLYLVADGVLSEASNARDENAQAGEPNLYLLHNGSLVFIAALAPQDNDLKVSSDDESGSDWALSLSYRTTNLTPDGRQLLFSSIRPLTGYENVVRQRHIATGTSGSVMAEAFLYSADDGRLTCVSCSPTGAPPPVLPSEAQGVLPDSSPIAISSNNSYLRRWMSSDGDRVFFQTPLALLAGTQFGLASVYEWEREGTSGCRVATSVSGGCVFLISGAPGSDASFFIDASESGGDVFFAHRGSLVPGANAEVMELYDAHECSVGAPCGRASSTACTGTGCQGVPPAPPIFATPSSVTFAGTGNFPPPTPVKKVVKKTIKCKKGDVKNKKGHCIKKKSKKRAKKSSKLKHGGKS
jgi:hypothetical protein